MALVSVKIIDYGICEPTGVTTKDQNSNSPTGHFLHSDDIKFSKKTDEFSVQRGLSFGISYQLETANKEEEIVDFICRISHPTLTNSDTNEQHNETIEAKDGWSNELGFDFYSFEFDWELQRGKWTFEIISNQQVMCCKTFTLN